MYHAGSAAEPAAPVRPMPTPQAPLRRIRLVVEAVDPLSRAGIYFHLADRPNLELLPPDRIADAELVVFAAPALNASMMARLRARSGDSERRLVLVLDQLGDIHLASAIQLGVAGILWRANATAKQLIRLITATADGSYCFPPELQTQLITDLANQHRDVLKPLGLNLSGLETREIDVLSLIADGLDIAEIAQRVMYSERTVKSILYGAMARLNLRTRSQAVAYAMRAGHF